MAEHLSKRQHILSDSEEDEKETAALIRCAICLSVYQDPIKIDCSHSFCRQCIKQLTTKKCPICVRPITKAWYKYASNKALVDAVRFATGSNVYAEQYDVSQASLKFEKNCCWIMCSGCVLSFVISPDSRYVATCGYSKHIIIWDIESADKVKTIEALEGPIYSIAYNSDGSKIVSGHDSGVIRIWKTETGELIKELHGHTSCIKIVAFSPDDTLIASGSYDCTLRVQDIEQRRVHVIQTNRSVVFATFLPGNTRILYGVLYDKVGMYDISSGQDIQLFDPDDITNTNKDTAVSPDGMYVVRRAYGKGLCICDINRQQMVDSLIARTNVLCSIAFSSDSKYLVTGCNDRKIRIWNVVLGIRIQTLSGHFSYSASFSPNNKYLVSRGNNELLIWKLKQ